MCKINCSGGCRDCAPDEHRMREMFEEWLIETTGMEPDCADIEWDVFQAGWAAAIAYSKTI